ncbi:hypothetical protein NEUTE1DRAFT_47706 [Neurospora tetrasperma FGSC 2508]|uniref:Uncharacterized protein n=1 Tax=Neurospora tetrasperma (strain FGSC 2508 / ATCC MYA-4615 / P0657) TaxID=510951 RepID=F8MSI5_NEUT8|nr:uncharacterized protein NEUTE1DRAFT_47706 [Neurospora tetrasperma FGSC 2508]EGO55072.1 hypothetical protein NEUTE1DRAFT_47706 [Neurospora tetrasperma FGSC 2508]EGZ69722.1 hypothetical protein NEUTE2DRAFT_70100 [Neurospora tetrasperma FGSC 2509]
MAKREVRCDIIPGDPRMWESHGRFCLLDFYLHPNEEVVIPQAGTDLCVRGSGKLRAGVSGDGDRRTTKQGGKGSVWCVGEMWGLVEEGWDEKERIGSQVDVG